LNPDHFVTSPKACHRVFSSRSNLKPELPSQYDWHVQPDCQRPTRFPPRRCAFSRVHPFHPARPAPSLRKRQAHRIVPDCPRNLSNLPTHSRAVNLWKLWNLRISNRISAQPIDFDHNRSSRREHCKCRLSALPIVN
jgi:hypothetical protein